MTFLLLLFKLWILFYYLKINVIELEVIISTFLSNEIKESLNNKTSHFKVFFHKVCTMDIDHNIKKSK